MGKNPFKINLKWLILFLFLAFIGWQLYKPKPAPPPPPPLLNDPVQIYVGGEPMEAGDHFWVNEVKGKVYLGKTDSPHEPGCQLKEGFSYKIDNKTHPKKGLTVLVERGTEKSILLKYRKENW